MLDDFIREGMPADLYSEYGNTALRCAAERSYSDIVTMLLDRIDVDPELLRLDYQTPLIFTAKLAQEDMLRLLLKNGVDVNRAGDHSTALHIASTNSHYSFAQILLETGTAFKAKYRALQTPLFLYCTFSNEFSPDQLGLPEEEVGYTKTFRLTRAIRCRFPCDE